MLREATTGPGRAASKGCLAVPITANRDLHQLCISHIIIPKHSKTSARSPKLTFSFKRKKKKAKQMSY